MRTHLLAGVLMLGCAATLIAQGRSTGTWTPSRTFDGQIDLEGVWDFSTITPLERPVGLGDKQTFTDAEAATFEREENLRQNRDLIDPKKGGGQYLPGSVIPYNEFWYERGSKIVGSKRTSLDRRSARRTHTTVDTGGGQAARGAGGRGARRTARSRSC